MIDKDCSFTDREWFFYNLVSSKHCFQKDIVLLKHSYNLPEIMKMREYLDIMEATEMAYHLDESDRAKAMESKH